MFGVKKTEDKAGAGATGALNSLVNGTIVDGNVFCESDIRIDGEIKGNLTCSAKVIIGASGKIVGEIRCENAVIEGSVEGILIVKDLLTLKETAHVVADVRTGSISIQAGAYFNATCKMTENKEKLSAKLADA